MTAWRWTQIRRATKIELTPCVDWEVDGSRRSGNDEMLPSQGIHKLLHNGTFWSLTKFSMNALP